MATLALSLAGQVAGGAVGGPIGATIGRALGALAGSAIDSALFGEPAKPGADLRLQGSSEAAPIPRLYGWSRLSGNIIWAADLEEIGAEGLGAKGGTAERGIAASFAIGLCEGVAHRLGRVWADGQLLDAAALTLRFHRGTETQLADPLIATVQGDDAPAYRGLCYLVFERLPLAPFGNRIPNISAELCRVVGDLEPAVTSITVIPGATEFGYDPAPRVRLASPGVTEGENTHLARDVSDWSLSIDELVDLCPNLENVALVVAWFGNDLRCGECAVAPRVEAAARDVLDTEWEVAGLGRGDVEVVSLHEGGPSYGGTPSDASVRAAITDLTARGIGVTLYPILLMDIPADNLMDQPAYPWRGRLSCVPGDDGSSGAVTQANAFAARHRDFILHYAQMAAEEGAEALLIGSELRGMTQLRGPDDTFPFVAALVDLAADVRALVGPDMTLTYAADWSEYHGYQPGGGEKFFHLDPLWASDAIDVVGIDNYMPLTDQRGGAGPYDAAELAESIAGGEGFDWYYASEPDRTAGTRTPITDWPYSEPWVWRVKDLAAWWTTPHHDRPGGVRDASPTGWVPESKPVWFTELGAPAIHRGANQPNVFLDPKSAESFAPYFSNGAPDALLQRQVLRAALDHWTGSAMVERLSLWTWDARPYPVFPARVDVWADGANHATGHWLTGRLGGMAGDELLRALAADYGVTLDHVETAAPFIHGYVVEVPMTLRQAMEPLLAAGGLAVRDGVDGLSVGTPQVELEAGETVDAGGPLLTRRRPDRGEAIGRVALSYWDRERDYLSGSVTAIGDAEGALATATTGLVLDIGAALLAAGRLLDEGNAQRETVELTLPPSQLALEVGDAIAVGGESFKVVEIRDGLARKVVARSIRPEREISTSVVRPNPVGGEPPVRAVPVVTAAHLPPLPADLGHTRLALGAFARPWPGGVTVTDETTGTTVAMLDRRATLGTLAAPFGVGTMFGWDGLTTLEVELLSGHLASRDDAEVLAGANRLVVETDTGEWEMIGFADVELIAPLTYRLTRLLRRQGGTDHAIGGASAGNRVMVLDDGVEVAPLDPAWLGAAAELLCFAGPTDATGVVADVEIGLAPILPLAPVHLSAVADGGDIALGWVRRSRADIDSWATEDAPLDWAPEAYRVEIFDGSTLMRTIAATAPSATYTAAQQASDFGGPATSFAFRVAQVSALYGPGHWANGDFNA
jgi:hypothetical protein